MEHSVGEVLLDILIVLVAAKIAAEIAVRLNIPAVVGEIIAGAVIGPSVLGIVGPDETLRVLGEIGVILLLLQVGMEMDLGELRAVGRAAVSVAVIGVVLPVVSGIGVMAALGEDGNTALFIGTALAATSVGITARVFSDLRSLGTVEARTVLGAAVADDVLGLVLLTVVVRVVTEGSVSVLSVLGIVGVALGFLVATGVLGIRLGPAMFGAVHRHARSAGTLVALALAFTLAIAELADAARLAPIVGAFMAGIALSRSDQAERIERELTPLAHLFVPVFFLQIGIDVEVDRFVDPSVLGIAAAMLVVACIGKLAAGLAMGRAPGDKLLVGLGMLPRGEVGLIFATIGLETGVLDDDLYAALLLVVLVTTLVAPPLLRMRLLGLQAGRRPEPAGPPAAMPEAGWLTTEGGRVELTGPEPPAHLRLPIALDAALSVTETDPGPELLAWLGRSTEAPVRFDREATSQFLALLRHGNARSWRFLETTGVLERALPELAEAVHRRRADPFVVDPGRVLTFDVVDELARVERDDVRARLEWAALEHPEWLALAALVLDINGPDASPVALARQLAKRFDLGAAAEQEIALLVGDNGLMRTAAIRHDALDEDRVLDLASRLERPERARALYVLSLALGALEAWDRTRLDELLRLVLDALEHPDLVGLEARNLVESRRSDALRRVVGGHKVEDRIRFAPRGYVLQQEAEDVALEAGLLDPLPIRGRARVAVRELEPGRWRIVVASRDQPGLLARVTGVLADHGLDVDRAVVASWPDGAALESFVARGALGRVAPDADAIAADVADSFERTLAADPVAEARIAFDEDGSPWYTTSTVQAPDRRGLLHTLATAFAAAGAEVHSARVATVDGEATDHFELTDRNGRKLDESARARLIAAVHEGVAAGRRPAPPEVKSRH